MKHHRLTIIALASGLVALSACEQPAEDHTGGEFENAEPAVNDQFEVEDMPDPNAVDPTLAPEVAPPAADPEASDTSPGAAEDEMVDESAQEAPEIESEVPE